MKVSKNNKVKIGHKTKKTIKSRNKMIKYSREFRQKRGRNPKKRINHETKKRNDNLNKKNAIINVTCHFG